MSFEEIDQYISCGDYAAALTLARQIHALHPANLDAVFYLAKAEFMSGNLAPASELIEQLTKTSANDSAVLHYLRGNVCVAKQALSEAASAFEAAITRDPSFAMAFTNLGVVRRQSGDVDDARVALSRAAALAPDNVVAWTELAHLHREAGAVADAEACFERALALDASVTSTWVALGNLLTETFKFSRAKQCFERALVLTPGHESALSTLGFVLGEMGETLAAQAALEAKVHHPPSLPRRVRSCLLLPQIYNNIEDLQYWRNRFSNGLDVLLDADDDGEEVWKIGQSNFLLAYQGHNDRDFQVRYAEFLRARIARQRPDFLKPSKHDAELKRKGSGKGNGKGKGRRIRVVFVSSFFRQCTVGQYFRSWIADLDPKVFERIVIHTGWDPDEFGLALQKQCDQFLVVRGGVLQVAEAVRSLAADIVIYPEVGMAVMNYLLANMRLAPIQIAAWGHPVTTGSSEIDYFLSCASMEPTNASSHYTERLLMLPGVGTCYAMPETVNARITRESFGLSHDSHLYICPQSLFKIHPDNDAIYFEIMVRDAKAVLLFFQSDHAAITRAFSQRLAAGMAAQGIAPRNQIKFLPRMDSASFRGVLSLANVVLDTLHWSGGNTSLDTLSVAAPIITLPGEFMRGRQTEAMLRAMDASELIANSHAAYVDKSIALASDNVMRESVRQKLIANRGAIFDRSEPVKQLAEHLQMLFESQAQ